MESKYRSLLIRISAFLLVVFGCLCSINCYLGPEGDPIIGVNGFIYDSGTNSILEGVWYTMEDTAISSRGVTDSTGSFQMIKFGNPPKEMHLYFGKEGYRTFDTVVRIPPYTRSVDSVEIYLERD